MNKENCALKLVDEIKLLKFQIRHWGTRYNFFQLNDYLTAE